jgi:hypothetical protein
MGAIIIKADDKNNKILKELAKRLGASVLNLKDSEYEDFLMGKIIESELTDEVVSREEVFKILQRK